MERFEKRIIELEARNRPLSALGYNSCRLAEVHHPFYLSSDVYLIHSGAPRLLKMPLVLLQSDNLYSPFFLLRGSAHGQSSTLSLLGSQRRQRYCSSGPSRPWWLGPRRERVADKSLAWPRRIIGSRGLRYGLSSGLGTGPIQSPRVSGCVSRQVPGQLAEYKVGSCRTPTYSVGRNPGRCYMVLRQK